MENPVNNALFPPELWKEALEKYATAANLTVQLFDTDERPVLGPIHPTPLFELFDSAGYNSRFFARCARASLGRNGDAAVQVKVSQFHGLTAVGAPLALEGGIVGTVVAGYIFAEFSQVSEIHWISRDAGITFDRLWSVARKQQPVPQHRLMVFGELLQTLGEALLRENFRTRQYQHANAIITSSGDAIIGENLYGVITAWNTGAERLYGYSVDEALGKPITPLLNPPGHIDEEPDILKRIRDGESIDHYETVGRRKDGALLDVSLRVSPISNERGRIVGASKIARDITKRKHAEEALREAHGLLDDRARHLETLVQQRTAGLQEAVGELEAFSYSVAHDLRAPLRAMKVYASLLLEDSLGKLSTRSQDYVQRIERAAARLDRLTQEILSYSKLSQAKVVLQPIELDPLLDDILEQYPEFADATAAGEKTIDVRRPLLPVLGHESFLTQVFFNLLSNARKFVAPGRSPKVVVRTEAIGDDVRIWVEDNGIGIAPEHADRLFQIFGRIHPDDKYEGTGIGLAIVKKASERMGGSVGFESEAGKGSRFWVQLKKAS